MNSPAPDHLDCSDATALDSEKPERRWPAWYALVTASIFPATTTLRTGHVSLASAWLVHLVTAVPVAYMAIALLLAHKLDFSSYGAFPWTKLTDQASFGFIVIMVWSGGLLVLEFLYLALAIIAVPFGARLERFGDSVRHGLRRTWLHSGHVLAAIVFALFVTVGCRTLHQNWNRAVVRQFQRGHPPPAQPTDREDKTGIQAYQIAIADWSSAQADYLRKHPRPWYVAYHWEIAAYFELVAAVWVVWALSRGLGAPRPGQPENLTPRCRACGYNLTGHATLTHCSECGQPVQDSMVPAGSLGTFWERRTETGRWLAYKRTVSLGLWRPVGLARSLNPASSQRHSLRFLAIHLLACAIIVTAGTAFSTYLTAPPRIFRTAFTTFCPKVGLGVALVILLATGFTALIVGLYFRWRDGSNLLSGVAQLASYCSGYWVLSTTVCTSFIGMLVVVYRFRPIHSWGPWSHGRFDLQMTLLAIAPCAAAVLGFLVLVLRGSAGVRYAIR
jgi:hypothetical protein